MTNTSELSVDLLDVLRPLLRRLVANRTLSLGKTAMLNRLANHGPATASELASSEKISQQAAAIAVRELEEHGRVTRTPDEADRRKMLIEITDAGRQELRRQSEAGDRWFADAVSELLDADERAALAGVIPILQKLVEGPSLD